MDRRAQVFSVGYTEISDVYLEDVSTASLAFSALDGLSTLDPAVDFVRRGPSLLVTDNGTPFAKFTIPESDAARDWARLTSAATQAAIGRSAILSETEDDRLYEAAFDRIAGKLDRYSRYHNATETRSAEAARKGYVGIGITISKQDDRILVMSVFQHAPARAAGLRPGDAIVSVGGRDTAGLEVSDVANLLRGPHGTAIAVVVERDGKKSTHQVDRRLVIEDTVHAAVVDGIPYFHVSGFNMETAHALEEAVEAARDELGEDLPGLILDLRQNRGGNLDRAVEVADLFVDDGTLLETQGRHGDSLRRYEAEEDTTVTRAPMTVLIDSGSASAAEVVAAALQDSGRALVIGARSFGKGTVQRVIKFRIISSELILTWARMHAPSGYALSDYGVFPSICTPDHGNDPAAGAAALERGELRLSDTILRRMNVERLNPVERQSLNDWCRANHPPSTEDGDTKLAVRLLSDSRLFRLAYHGSRVALGARPN
jgi:carboxyl-terminal processing protease